MNCKTCGVLVVKPRTLTQLYCSVKCVVRRLEFNSEQIIEAMSKYRYKEKPNWTVVAKSLNANINTIKRWAKAHELLDEQGNGPIVDGQVIVKNCDEYEYKPINPYLVSQEHLMKRLIKNREIDEVTNCWIWIGNWNSNGYGCLSLPRPYNDRHFLVQNAAAYIWLNEPLITNKFIFHKCRMRACFNPDHLILCKNRKKLARLYPKSKGEDNGRCIITLETALDVRDAIIFGEESNKQIADRLGIRNHIVWQIAHKRTWKHIWKLKHEYS